jgi:putative DNA primase/helicase
MMGQWLAEHWFIVKGTDGELYRWHEGVYVPAEESINAAVLAVHHRYYQRGRAEDVVNWLKLMPALDLSLPLPEPLVNFKNGVLNVETLTLLPPSPDYLTRIQIPVDWDEDAECPDIDRFLAESVSPDAVDTVWEMIGYALSGTNKYQRSFLLFGPGGNGKSKLLAMMNALLGRENMCANTLSALSSNRFRCAQLYGKLANVCGDIGEDLIDSTETFKQLVGGDPIEVEKKGQDPFTLENRAILVFSANGFPKVTDHSQGYFERFVFVSMPVKFRGTDREIPGIEKKLTQPEELRGAVVRAIMGLRRLEKRQRFAVTDSGAQLAGDYKKTVDSVEAFITDCVVFESNAEVKNTIFYQAYRDWCAEMGLGAKSGIKFWREFRQNFGQLVDERKRDGYPWQVGCRVNYGVGHLGGWQ